MKLDLLALQNFKSYREALLELGQVAQAAVVGHNGAGKSSILDAVLWVLFGKGAFDGAADDWITRGEQDARVELTFALDGQTYRVIRARTNRSRGKTVLELQRQQGAEWIPMTKDNIGQTQAEIERLLRLDFGGFVASAFLLQGRSAEFTAKTPAERKRVLYQILGLDQYDTLAAAARDKARGAVVQAGTIRQQITEADGQLARRPEVEQERRTILDRQAGIAGQIQETSQTITITQAALQHLDAQLAQEVPLRARTADLGRERQAAESQGARARQRAAEAGRRGDDAGQRVERAQKITARADEIRAKAAEQERTKSRLLELARLHEQDQALYQVSKTAERRVQGARERIDRAWPVASQEAQIRARAAERDQLQPRREEMDRRAAEDRRLREALSIAKAAHSVWTADRRYRESRLTAELEAAKGKADLLAADFGCDSPTKGHGCQFLADAYQAQQRMGELDASLTSVRRESPPAEAADIGALEQEITAAGYDPAQHQQVQRQLAELEPWARKLPELEQATAAITAAKAEIAAAEAEIAQAKEQQAALRYDQAEHRRLQDALPELERWARLVPDLAAAAATITAAEAEITQTRADSEAARRDEQAAAEAATGVERRRLEVEQQLRTLEPVRRDRETSAVDLASHQRSLQALRTNRERAGQDMGRVEERLRQLDALAAARAEKEETVTQLAREQTVWAALTEAFGPGGIPALIIENAVPELEATANALLGRLSGGTMSVRLDTQRQAKNTGNVSETLDIVISDALGDRPYETYSGGERFRVDFALRVALAKLLARRAGATVRCLWVDEGVAPLDADGRQRFVECIRAIEPDFDQVFVISHVEELNDQFAARIEVWKDNNGSHLRVTA